MTQEQVRLVPIGEPPFDELRIATFAPASGAAASGDAFAPLPQKFAVSVSKLAPVGRLTASLADLLGTPREDVALSYQGRELNNELTISGNVVAPHDSAGGGGGEHALEFGVILAGGVAPSPVPAPRVTQAQVGDLAASGRARQGKPRPPLKQLLHFQTHSDATDRLKAGLCTTLGPRPANEDANVCACSWTTLSSSPAEPPMALFAVCDGHGGDAVARLVAEGLAAALDARVQAGGWADRRAREAAVRQAFMDVDCSIRQSNGPSSQSCGSTCVAAIIAPKGDGAGESGDGGGTSSYRVVLANLGDSRGLLYRLGGDALAETLDHKPQDAGERRRIRDAGGYVSSLDPPPRLDGRLAVSRCFGDFQFKADGSRPPEAQKLGIVPDVYELEAGTGDFLVLASDGLFDVLSSVDAAAIALQSLKDSAGADDGAVDAAADIVWEALQRETGDNTTGLVVVLG